MLDPRKWRRLVVGISVTILLCAYSWIFSRNYWTFIFPLCISEWSHLNSWAWQSLVVNEQGQKSIKTAIKCSWDLVRSIETQRSKFLVIKYIKKYCYQTMLIIKVVLLFFYSSTKKNQKDSADLWHRKMTLKTQMLLYLTFHSKLNQTPRTFFGSFHRPLAFLTHL